MPPVLRMRAGGITFEPNNPPNIRLVIFLS